MGDRKNKLRLAVLVSGNGSNLQAIIDAIEKKGLSAKIAVVISNNPKALALERAKRHKVPCEFVATGPDFETSALKILKKAEVDLICLAGFMKILSPSFIKEYPRRILNIHPSLLPAFPGLHAQRKALEAGVKISGATVHLVDEGCDTGPIILQSAVPVLKEDTIESLSERILKEEHKIYSQAIQLIATESLKIVDGRVLITTHKGGT